MAAEFTRLGIASALKRNAGDKDALVSIINQVGTRGESQALLEGYADIIAKGLRNREPEVVSSCCRALSKMGLAGAAYVDEIGPLIGESSRIVRAAALEALGCFGYDARSYVPQAATMASADSSDFVKAAAIRMLGSLGADEEAAIVRSALESSSDVVASAAVESLGKMGLLHDDGQILVDMLKKPSICGSALAALAEMGYKAPVDVLELVISIGLTQSACTYRELAVSIIGNLAEATAHEPHLGNLKSVLSNSSPGARAAAAMAFGNMGMVAASQSDALLPLLSDSGEEAAGPDSALVVGTNAKRSSPQCRLPKAAAVWALGQMKSLQHLQRIGDCMNDSNWEVRLTALDAAGILGADAKELAEMVAAQLRDPAYLVRASAAHVLGQMVAVEYVEDLVQALTDQSHSFGSPLCWLLRSSEMKLGIIHTKFSSSFRTLWFLCKLPQSGVLQQWEISAATMPGCSRHYSTSQTQNYVQKCWMH
jgi:HEAT repeat protein